MGRAGPRLGRHRVGSAQRTHASLCPDLSGPFAGDHPLNRDPERELDPGDGLPSSPALPASCWWCDQAFANRIWAISPPSQMLPRCHQRNPDAFARSTGKALDNVGHADWIRLAVQLCRRGRDVIPASQFRPTGLADPGGRIHRRRSIAAAPGSQIRASQPHCADALFADRLDGQSSEPCSTRNTPTGCHWLVSRGSAAPDC